MKPSILITTIIIGCLLAVTSAAPAKTEAPPLKTGPVGMVKEKPPERPFLEQLQSPPTEIFTLESLAGAIFENMNQEKWAEAHAAFYQMQDTWLTLQNQIPAGKDVASADVILQKLTIAIQRKQLRESLSQLQQFTNHLSDIAKNYKLSPIADIISINNTIRQVEHYLIERDWSKSSLKAQEMQEGWGQLKPGLEQIGILSEVIKVHSAIRQTNDAVNTENKSAASEQLQKINTGMANILNFYKNK